MADRRASPLVTAKIHLPPRRAELLRRHRLVDQLYAHIDKQLFLITAPAGYGKTSLLVDFAHEADFAVAWYALDEFDNAPHTFLAYLIAAIRVPFPQFGAQALAALERATDSLEALQSVVAIIANELFGLPDHLVIILDDYHAIHNEIIDQLMALLIRYAGESCHFFLGSRKLPRIPDQILLLARGLMEGISINELKFTALEIQALIQQNYKLPVPEHRAHELAQLTDGWITALMLMGHQAGWRPLIEGALTAPDAAGRVYDYLAEQIFAHQPSDMQHFLLGSSVFDPLSPDLLDRLPRLSNASECLKRLHAQQLFINKLGGDSEAYSYHPLFREFLKERLQRDHPKWYEQLSLASASLYAEQGQWERAVEVYLSLRRHDDAAGTLEAAEPSLRSNAQVSSLMPWLEALPRHLTEFRPHIISLKAKSHFYRGELEQAASLFDRAAKIFLEAGDEAEAADKLLWKTYALQGLGRYQAVINETRIVENLLESEPKLLPLRALMLMQRGQAEFSVGEIARAYLEFAGAKELAFTTDDVVLQANICQNLGVAVRTLGRLSEALENYSVALRLWEDLQNPGAAAAVLNSLGYIYYLKGESQEAEKILQDGLKRAREARALRYEALTLSTLGDVYKDSGDYAKALEIYGQGLHVAQQAHYAYAENYIRVATGDTYRLLGDIGNACEWLNAALDDARLRGSATEIGQVQLALGLLAADQGRLAEALSTLSEVSGIFKQAGDKRLEALATFHLAHLLYLQGREGESAHHLMRVAELADLLGYDHFLVVAGRTTEVTLRFASTLDGVGSKFKRILERVRSLPYPSARTPALQTAPVLTIHTLGQERFAIGGAEVPPLRTQARDLFLFLLSRYPQGARRDELWELIWPGLSEERADASLRVTVTRIRKALCPITFSNGWYSLAPEHFWYDVHEFERALSDASRAQSARERISHLQQAIALYGGNYLERLQAEWATIERERLRKAYLNALIALAQAYSETGDLVAALRTYEKASNEEPLFELAWQGGMQTYARMGNRAAALAHYEKLKNILDSELSVEPSAEVQRLYRRILDMNV